MFACRRFVRALLTVHRFVLLLVLLYSSARPVVGQDLLLQQLVEYIQCMFLMQQAMLEPTSMYYVDIYLCSAI
jgi:hypothetical protein